MMRARGILCVAFRSGRLRGRLVWCSAGAVENQGVRGFVSDASAQHHAGNTHAVSADDTPLFGMLPETVATPELDVANADAVNVDDTACFGTLPETVATSEFGWWPTDMVYRFLDILHSSAGLEWWSSIVVGTVVIRLTILPVIVRAMRSRYTMSMLQPEVLRLQRQALGSKSEEDRAKQAHEMKAIYQRHNFHPLSPFAPIVVQGPIFMSIFFALRRMSGTFPEIAQGGVLWFVDLSTTDATCVLPMLTGLSLLAAVEAGMRNQPAEASPEAEFMKNIARGLCFTTPIFASYMPCSLLVYWVSANSFTLLQALLLSRPAVKAALHIPEVPAEVLKETARLRAELRAQWRPP